MARFFRKIRRDLISDHQILKYLKYAVGEIILVVLGILIALYINNQNELRKEQERLDQTLIDVENELAANINRCREALNFFFYCDSIVNRILYDGLTPEDYMNEERLTRLTNIAVWYDSPTIQDESFKNLKQKSGSRSEVQDSIILELSELYIEKKSGIDMFVLEAHNTVMENRKMYSEFDWYKDWWITGYKNPDMIDFLVNDQRHETAVINFSSIVLENLRRMIEGFEIMALNSYHRIHKYLEKNQLEHNHSINFDYDIKDFQHYTGKYIPYENSTVYDVFSDSMVIAIENEKLYYKIYYGNGKNFKTEIIPVNKYHFRTNLGAGFHRFDYTKSRGVSEMTFSDGKYRLKSKKVN